MAATAKRTVMMLYSDPQDIYSHQIRIVIAVKGVNVEIKKVESHDLPAEVLEINPYGTVPTLLDRDLALYHAPLIMEYLDERFPHPPLLPVYPVARAECRKMMYRIEQDWYRLMQKIEGGTEKQATEARKQLRESIISVAPVFANKPYFLSDEFTLVDCCIVPLLWRLPQLGIELPAQAKAVKEYAKRQFDMNAFQTSLTDIERELVAA